MRTTENVRTEMMRIARIAEQLEDPRLGAQALDVIDLLDETLRRADTLSQRFPTGLELSR